MKAGQLILIFILSSFLAACDNQRVFEQTIDNEHGKWAKDDGKLFEFHITDTALSYNIYYYVRASILYPYRNLYLNYKLSDNKNKVLSNKLQNMNLFDDKTGKPLGSGLGDINDLSVLSLENFHFPDTGKYTFEVKQYMRQDTLSEIFSIGLRVETSN